MLSEELQTRWSGKHCIGEVESVPLVLAVIYLAKYLVGRDAVWWIDNSSTLGACIKGGSRAEDLDRSVITLHLACAMLGTRIWFEYVESKSNWADGSSRLLLLDPWSSEHGFSMAQVHTPEWPWKSRLCELADHLKENLRAALE